MAKLCDVSYDKLKTIGQQVAVHVCTDGHVFLGNYGRSNWFPRMGESISTISPTRISVEIERSDARCRDCGESQEEAWGFAILGLTGVAGSYNPDESSNAPKRPPVKIHDRKRCF